MCHEHLLVTRTLLPASKLLEGHYRSGRGACRFVLVADPEVASFSGNFPQAVIHRGPRIHFGNAQ
jgi:hypothetical protein